MRREKISPWQIMAYSGLAILTLWLILKVAGIIQTPVWLEYGVPIAGGIIAVFGMYSNIIEKVNTIAVGLASLTSDVKRIDKDVEELKVDMRTVKKHLSL